MMPVERDDSLFLHLFRPLLHPRVLRILLYLHLRYYYLYLNYFLFHSRAHCYDVESFDVVARRY
jgi:hypothetical protein